MSDKPAAQRRIQDFPGLLLEIEPNDQPPGASDDQVNAISVDIGVLQSRGGFDIVTFEGE